MKLATWLYKTWMCAAVLGVGCVREGSMEDEAPDAADDEEGAALGLIKLGDGGGGGGTVVGVETLDVMIPASLHAQGLALPAKLVRPKWSKSVGKQPGVLVLHGSGGLLKMPESKSDKPCSPEMESQFEDWSERLAKLGYTVLLPSSYSARGFCDAHKDTDRIPDTFDQKPEVVLGRIYDADAAARYLCGRPEVDCKRLGQLGFSQGATAVMTTQHWQLDRAIDAYREEHAGEIDVEVPDLGPGRPQFKVGIAYYPGCGFDGLVPLSTGGKAKIEDKYSSTAPLLVLHASEDPLIEHCSVEYGSGARETQAGQVAGQLKTANTYDLTVYEDAGHSFDSPGGSGSGGGHDGDDEAKAAARKVTLAALAEYL